MLTIQRQNCPNFDYVRLKKWRFLINFNQFQPHNYKCQKQDIIDKRKCLINLGKRFEFNEGFGKQRMKRGFVYVIMGTKKPPIIKMRVSCCLHANSFLFIIKYTNIGVAPRGVFCPAKKFLYQLWISNFFFVLKSRTAWRLCIKLSDGRFMLGQAHASYTTFVCPEKSLEPHCFPRASNFAAASSTHNTKKHRTG